MFQIPGTIQQVECDNGYSCMYCLLSTCYVTGTGPGIADIEVNEIRQAHSQSSKTDNQVSDNNKVDMGVWHVFWHQDLS